MDSTNGDPVLDAANPLSKIPCLVLDDGTGVYDSRSITRYLDRVSGGKLFPTDSAGLLKAERMEALCDGINDCALVLCMKCVFVRRKKFTNLGGNGCGARWSVGLMR